jgi:hypothetical protein
MMDINYLLAREQTALRMAETTKSRSARIAHLAFAKAYGLLLAAGTFPHNRFQTDEERQILRTAREMESKASWENEGGAGLKDAAPTAGSSITTKAAAEDGESNARASLLKTPAAEGVSKQQGLDRASRRERPAFFGQAATDSVGDLRSHHDQ